LQGVQGFGETFVHGTQSGYTTGFASHDLELQPVAKKPKDIAKTEPKINLFILFSL
jgi:hypothetical protein